MLIRIGTRGLQQQQEQQNLIYGITSRAVDIIRSSYYIHGQSGDESDFCCFVCLTQRWALHILNSTLKFSKQLCSQSGLIAM